MALVMPLRRIKFNFLVDSWQQRTESAHRNGWGNLWQSAPWPQGRREVRRAASRVVHEFVSATVRLARRSHEREQSANNESNMQAVVVHRVQWRGACECLDLLLGRRWGGRPAVVRAGADACTTVRHVRR
jgi:hypothetical protein